MKTYLRFSTALTILLVCVLALGALGAAPSGVTAAKPPTKTPTPSGGPTATPGGGGGARPNTIPALREWTGSAGSYTFNASRRILYNGASLSDEAATFAADLLTDTGFTIPTVSGSSPSAGDIYLTLGEPDTTIGDEGYKLTIGSTVTISARAEAGAFYGTRTILQLLRQSFTLGAGSARDWPMYKLRGMHVDNGRKYFTPAWLRDHIRELSFLKMNLFHLHLSDREGFRIQLFNHPEVPTAPFLTQAEMTSLITFAAQYKVTIVPEIDSPGHLTAALRNHPELWQNGTGASQIDIGIDASYTFMSEIINELIPLFPGPYWHLGADEYSLNSDPHFAAYAQSHFCPPGTTASTADAFIGYVNWLNSLVKSHGKIGMAWHDTTRVVGNTCVTLNTDIIIDFWNHEPTDALSRGFTILNSNRWYTYYVLGGANNTPSEVYTKWNPAVFFGLTIQDAHPKNLGGKGLHIWCDNPTAETEAQIGVATYERLRGAGQNAWNSPKLVSGYSQFKPIILAIGRAPGYGEHLQ